MYRTARCLWISHGIAAESGLVAVPKLTPCATILGVKSVPSRRRVREDTILSLGI